MPLHRPHYPNLVISLVNSPERTSVSVHDKVKTCPSNVFHNSICLIFWFWYWLCLKLWAVAWIRGEKEFFLKRKDKKRENNYILFNTNFKSYWVFMAMSAFFYFHTSLERWNPPSAGDGTLLPCLSHECKKRKTFDSKSLADSTTHSAAKPGNPLHTVLKSEVLIRDFPFSGKKPLCNKNYFLRPLSTP